MPNLGLSLLPLHACYKSNKKQRDYLLDHFEITYAPSFDVLRHCQTRTSPELPHDPNLFAVANPQNDLDGADLEVERIADIIGHRKVRVLGSDQKNRATLEAVKTEMSKDYAFVHFACHGQFNLLNPLQSSLKLVSFESLTLETVLTLPKLPHTHLVVMSACETGMVDPGDLADEYLGLPAGFIRTGVPGVINTLWKVGDLSATLLMERFYLYLLKGDPNHHNGPLRPAQALRRAQHWLRDEVTGEMVADLIQVKEKSDRHIPDYPFTHPRHWAPFTLSGQ
jgi:CHAT domain-containing protein